MKTVKIHPLPGEKEFMISLPFNSEILELIFKEEKPFISVLEDTEGKMVERAFVTIAEGSEVPQRFNRTHYVGCYGVLHHGKMVTINVFENR